MKSLKYLAFCLVATLVTTSCSNDENEPQVSLKEGKPVKFEMSIAKANTRTVTTGSGNNRVVDWRVGDAVGIFVYNESTPLGSGNYKYVYDGTDWVAASTSDAINLQDGENYSFYAYYPYSTTGIASATNATLSVQTDQTTKDETTQNTGYDLSDILTAQTPNVSNGGTVALQFKHAFSMVEVLVAGDLVPSAPGSVILKNIATSAGINLTTGVVGATSANADVTMCLIESDPTKTTYLYRAIVPAQTILANNTLLEVHGVGENGNKNYEFAHTEVVPYEQGKYRRIEVQIGKVEAGIKIPGGAIDEWTPSGGIDVPGKEMISIVPKLSAETIFNAFYNKTAPTAEYGWYYFMAATEGTTDSYDKMTFITTEDESGNSVPTIEYTIKSGVALGWQNQSFGFATTECKAEKYKFSFELLVKGAITTSGKTAGVSIFMRDKAYKGGSGVANSFIISGSEDNETNKARSLFYCTTTEGDKWNKCDLTFDLTKMTANGPAASADIIDAQPDKDYSIVFIGMTYNGSDTPWHTLQIRNITLEKVE